MADFNESLEKFKAQLEPMLESLRENLVPTLLEARDQLHAALVERWQNTSRAHKQLAGASLVGIIALIYGCFYLYWHSEFYARRRLADLNYELTAAGLASACQKADLVALNFFSQAKFPIDSKDEKGLTTLISAAGRGQESCVQELLGRGADSNIKDEHGESAIFFAIRAESLETVNALIKAKSNLNFFAVDKTTSPLVAALAKPNRQIIQALLDAGADPNLQDANKHTPLFLAASLEDSTSLSLLLAKKADPNLIDLEGMTPLTLAITSHNRTNVQNLLKAGAKPNLSEDGAASPLHAAIDEDLPDVLQDLLDAGANPNQPNRSGITPLIRAVAGVNEKMVTALLAKGADANARVKLLSTQLGGQPADVEEYTALDLTYFMQNEEIPRIERQLKKGGGHALTSRTVRAGSRDWDTLKLIEKVHGPAAQFLRGRVIEEKKSEDLPVVSDLLKKFDLPVNQLILMNIPNPAILIATDSTFQPNSIVTLYALRWGQVQTSLGIIPVYVESNRNGALRRKHDDLLRNSYSHFLGEWADRIPSAYAQATRIKAGSGSGLSVDDLTLLSALIFGSNFYGGATQVYQAARTASLCEIQNHGSLTASQWSAELTKILDYVAKAEPASLLQASPEKNLDKRRVALQSELCGAKQEQKSDGGVVITYAQCMCGGYPTAPVPPPNSAHLSQLAQMLTDYREKLLTQAEVGRTPASK